MVDLPVTLLLEHLNLPMRDNKGYFYSHLFYEKYNSCRRWSFSLTLVGIKWKTAFNTPLGHSEYPVMAFRFSLLALPFTSSYSINPPPVPSHPCFHLELVTGLPPSKGISGTLNAIDCFSKAALLVFLLNKLQTPLFTPCYPFLKSWISV